MEWFGPLQPSVFERNLALPHMTKFFGSYRLFLLVLTFIFWSINVALSFYFPIKTSKKKWMQTLVFSGIVYSVVLMFSEFFDNENIDPLATLSVFVYVFRMHCWNSIASSSIRKETHVPALLSLVFIATNFFFRVCFTFGLFLDFHFLFQLIAFTIIVTSSTIRTYLSFSSSKECRNLQAQLPCIIFIFCLCLTFGREIIPERELCEAVLTFGLVMLPYLHEQPQSLNIPLTQIAVENCEKNFQKEIPVFETARRDDPEYQRRMTVLKLFYFLEDAGGRLPHGAHVTVDEDDESDYGEDGVSSSDSDGINFSTPESE